MKKNLWSIIFFLTVNSAWLSAGEKLETALRADTEFLSVELSEKYTDVKNDLIQFLNEQTSRDTGLVESFKGTSLYYYLPEQNIFELNANSYLAHQAFTDDLAAAIIFYTGCGQSKKARQIIDLLKKEFYREKGGRMGLFTSYRTDILSVDNKPVMGIDGDRIHVRQNMLVALACLYYVNFTGQNKYLTFAIDMAKWVTTLPHFKFPDGELGGVATGSGWGPDWSKIYSTSHCADYYLVLSVLRHLYIEGSDQIKEVFEGRQFTDKEIAKEIAGLERWFKEIAYNKDSGGFNLAFNEKGLDQTKSLDTVTYAMAIIGPEKLAAWEIDPFRLINFAEKNFLTIDNLKNKTVEGFDFTVPGELGNHRRRFIWIEGTTHMILAYKIMYRYCLSLGKTELAREYKAKAVKFAKELDKMAELANLPRGAMPYISYIVGEKERIMTFRDEWEIPRSKDELWIGSVGGAIWRFFSLTSFNPLAMGLDLDK